MNDKSMTTEQAYREYHASQDGYAAKRPEITMTRDSWDGGHTVQYRLHATCVASLIRSGDVVSYTGRWF